MSPNTLHLRMTTELSFLDNVQASLGQLQDLERIRTISIAQQELAQVIQTKQNENGRKTDLNRPSDDAAGSSLRNSTIQLLKSQTEVTRISAEATKQLTEINKAIVEQHGREVTSSKTTETVAAATAAAVTAALSQLKQELKRQKTHSHRAESSTATLSSEKSSYSEAATESSTSYSSGNSQKRGEDRTSGDKSRSGPNDSSATTGNSQQGTISEAIVVENDGGASKGGATTVKDQQVVEERSYRMLLPSESHRRSSLGNQMQRMASPGSDRSKNSSISEAISVGSEVPSSPTSVEGAGLFSGENSFQRFTLGMVKQYMEEEDMRTHHQKAITQLQEEASLRQSKDEMAWNKLHRKQNRMKGKDDKMPSVYNKKSRLISRNHAKSDLKKGDDSVQELGDVIEKSPRLNSSTDSAVGKVKKTIDDVMQQSDPTSSITDKFSSSDIKSEVSASTQDEESEAQITAKSNNNGKSKMLALPSSPSTTRVLQGLKKLQVSKRYLTKREQKLLQRRKNVEELLRWQRELDQEELKVQEMEQKALEILSDKRQATLSESIQESDKTSSSQSQELSTKLSSTQSSQHNSVIEQLVSGQPSEASLPEELSVVEDSANVTSKNTSVTAVTKLEESPKTVTSKSSESATSYSKETFEKLSISPTKTDIGSGDSAVFAASVFSAAAGKGSPQSSPKSKSIVLRSPLTPIRTLARKRCDSSGSEDSCTISQSETASEPSDIEGRIHALKKDLRQRKSEAERLKKEQKRKNVERLKEQEASLLKQIEAYDRYIYQAKLDLQKELEQDGGTKVLVKPVIMQPKVAESKRLQRQSALDKSPDQDDKKISISLKERKEAATDSSHPLDGSQAFIQASRDLADSGEESLETVKSVSSIDEIFTVETSKESEQEESKEIAVSRSGSALEEGEQEGSMEENTTERERSLDEMTVPAPRTTIENVPDNQDTDQSNIPNIDEDGGSMSLEEDIKSDQSFVKGISLESTVQEERSVGDVVEHLQFQLELPVENKSCEMTACDTKVPKNNAKMDFLADEITDYLMLRMLSDLKVPVTDKVDLSENHSAHSLVRDENETTGEEAVVAQPESIQIVDSDRGHQMAEQLLENLLDEALAAALRVRSVASVRGLAGNSIVLGSEESREKKCTNSHCPKERPVQKFSVSERVSSIMAEITEKQSPVASAIRQQDLLVLSFSEDLTTSSVAAQVAPLKITDYPLRSDPSSPIRRPSSPVFGEPGELSPLDLESRLLSLQASEGQVLDADDLMPGQEWFEDDFGLTEGSSMTASPVQHYQIYPYQDSYYIRQIPNKPPPPYTPPGKASLSTPPATLLSPLAQYDSKRLTTDFFRTTIYDEDEIRERVAKAAEFFYRKAAGSECGELPDNFFVDSDSYWDDDIASRSRRAYDHLLTNLTEEIVDGIYGHKGSERPPWLKPEWGARARAALAPKSLAELVSTVQAKALELLSDRKGPRAQDSSVLNWGRKKRDFVDEILMQELRAEEAKWVTYDEDEVAVKNQLTEAIFDQLIDQLVCDVKDVYAKKVNAR